MYRVNYLVSCGIENQNTTGVYDFSNIKLDSKETEVEPEKPEAEVEVEAEEEVAEVEEEKKNWENIENKFVHVINIM